MEAIDLPCKVIMDGEDEPYASVRRYNEIAKANKQLHEEMKHYADSIRAQFPHFSDNVKQPFRGKNQSTDALWKPARMPR